MQFCRYELHHKSASNIKVFEPLIKKNHHIVEFYSCSMYGIRKVFGANVVDLKELIDLRLLRCLSINDKPVMRIFFEPCLVFSCYANYMPMFKYQKA